MCGNKGYRIEDFNDKTIKHMDSFMRNFFQDLKIEPIKITSSVTRFEHDDSDFTSWVLYYGKNMYSTMQEDKQKLLNIVFKNKPVFSVTGNGYGTGLSIGLNLGEKYDDL